MTSLSVRQLSREDLAIADRVFRAAYNTVRDGRAKLENMIVLEPEGIFVAEYAGEIVGLVTNVDYRTFGYVGMLGVSPTAQGKGVGRALMLHSLEWFSGRDVPTILLDATASGKPLYEKLGFTTQGEAQLWRYEGGSISSDFPLEVQLLRSEDVPRLAHLDAPMFGGDRSKVLGHYARAYPKRSLIALDNEGQLTGFLIAQRRTLGPWVAVSPEVAKRLLDAALTLPFEEAPAVIIPPENQQGIALFTERGFRLERSCDHMRLGPSVEQQRYKLYGQTSFALG